MTFGYDSSLFLSRSTACIEDFARELLNLVWSMRRSSNALILAEAQHHIYGDILESTIGVVFMGTPHRGAEILTSSWISCLTNMIQATFGSQLIRTDLLRDLRPGSSTLEEISQLFLPRTSKLMIMTFVELLPERPLTTLVCLKSATLTSKD
ncbi:hypothetical protein N7540_006339 [Penicillium herquei]|nr:hypothetical protein N7540_006339 [Penicillium herquei]